MVRPAFVLRTAPDGGICGVVGASCPTLQVIPAVSRPGLAVAAMLLLGLGAWAIRGRSVFKSAG